MKTIAHLKGEEFLAAAYYAAEEVENLARETDFLKIWKKKPVFTGNETQEEQLAMHRKQLLANVRALLKELMVTNAKATYKCILAMCVLDEDAPEPDGIELLGAAMTILSDKRVLDFLLQLGKLGLFNTEA